MFRRPAEDNLSNNQYISKMIPSRFYQDDDTIHVYIKSILSVIFQSQMLLTDRILTVCTFFFIRRLGIIICQRTFCKYNHLRSNFQIFVCRVGVEPTIPYSVSNGSRLADITTQTIKGCSRNSCSHCESIVVLPTSPCQSGATLPFVHRHIYF